MLAVATLIEMESEVIFSALDSNVSETQTEGTPQSNYRGEPVAFFFIIYGLCFQTLLKMINRDDAESKRIIPIVLNGLKKFLRPSISGNAIYKGFVFAETTDLLDRLVLMENGDVQIAVVRIASSLARCHPHSVNIGHQSRLCYNFYLTNFRILSNGDHAINGEESISDEIEQLLDLVHILILALNKSIPFSAGTTQGNISH
jgi:HEAT repeat-containing protein 5